MELVDGETLAARLATGTLPLDQVLRYGAQIADALAAAHAKGIIHRDLKPANLMLTKAGIKVLDFGLAKSQTDETVTRSQAVMGTPAYMAPEQRQGREADARTDVYAFGLVLREMANGKHSERLQGFPASFVHVVERCLEPDPDERWQTTRDVKKELEWAASSRPTDRALPAASPRKWQGGSRVRSVGKSSTCPATVWSQLWTRATWKRRTLPTPVPLFRACPTPSQSRPGSIRATGEISADLPSGTSRPVHGADELVAPGERPVAADGNGECAGDGQPSRSAPISRQGYFYLRRGWEPLLRLSGERSNARCCVEHLCRPSLSAQRPFGTAGSSLYTPL